MSVKVNKNFGRLEDIPLSNRELIRELLLLARERVIRRTLAGQSSEGVAFVPYSPGYLKAKRKALGTSGRPNLQASGRMLNEITIVELTDTRGTLGFSS